MEECHHNGFTVITHSLCSSGKIDVIGVINFAIFSEIVHIDCHSIENCKLLQKQTGAMTRTKAFKTEEVEPNFWMSCLIA